MLNKIKIGPKLIGGFIIVVIIAVAIGIIGIVNVKAINDADTRLYEKMTVPISMMSDVSTYFQRVRINSRDVIRKNDPREIQEAKTAINDLSAKISNHMDVFEKLIISNEMKKAFEDFKNARSAYRVHLDKMIELAEANKDAEAYALLDGEARASAMTEQATIDKIIELKVADAKQTSDDNTKTANMASMIMILCIIFGVVLALVIGIALTISITGPLQKGLKMMIEMAKGHLGIRLKMTSTDEIGLLANAMDEFADDLQNNVVATVKKIGEGDLSSELKAKDNQDEITPAIVNTTNALRGLIAEAGMLRTAAIEGKLATRGNANNFKGGYKEIVSGVNDTLDAVIGPLNVAAEYVDRISKGDIPQKITDKYNGDFNEIKNNLNQCIDAVNALVIDAKMLSKAAVEGKLATRADASKHQGDFARIVQGVDDCLDAVIGPLNVAAEYVDRISKGDIPTKITDNYNGDFNNLKNNLNQCIDAVNLLVTDAKMLAQAGIEGRLATRADGSKHQGDFRKIVDGVNGTLDAVIIPINEASQVLEKIANRDLTSRVKGDYKGDLGKIKDAINSAADNLDVALTQVSEATEQVSSGSQQISAGSQSLAQGANEQASSLEEVSSSLEEMASMTKQNAENANQAKKLSGEADGNAREGGEAMTRMSSAINRIKESSDQTAKIVKTIDEIAMQTNLLALNAAVEAARAGEAGRGFAVVAEEVRNLAQRSAQAAKNTADMISESVKNADDGVKIASEVSKSFDSIAGSSKKVNDLIAEIAAASAEQSQGIDQVNTAVAQMDKVTQQNAASSEESASAAEEMSSQAEELQSMIAQFLLTNTSHKVSAASSTRHLSHSVAAVESKKFAKSPSKNGNGNGKKALSIKAEQLIPMNDDELKEF